MKWLAGRRRNIMSHNWIKSNAILTIDTILFITSINDHVISRSGYDLPVVQMLATTLPIKPDVCTFSTWQRTTDLHQLRAVHKVRRVSMLSEEHNYLKHNSVFNFLVFGLSLFVRLIATMEINDDAKTFRIFTHVYEPTKKVQDKKSIEHNAGTYRGLSGITRDPAARIAPITHCIKSGIRHARSESMKEQK